MTAAHLLIRDAVHPQSFAARAKANPPYESIFFCFLDTLQIITRNQNHIYCLLLEGMHQLVTTQESCLEQHLHAYIDVIACLLD